MAPPALRTLRLLTLLTVLVLGAPTPAWAIVRVTTPQASSSTPPPAVTPTGTPAAPGGSPSVSIGPTGGLLGAPDTTSSLGGTDANCSRLQGVSSEVVRNCSASGLAESPFPPANYGLDVHVNTGITDPVNDIAAGVQQGISWIYGLTAHVLTWILMGLGLAFGFDLFQADRGGQIQHGLASAQHGFTTPLLPLAIVIGGGLGLVYWFGQRREGRALSHWLAMFALMGLGIIIATNPVGALGWADQASNDLANGALVAFTGTGGGSTSSGFSNAVPGIYRTVMEEPWCSMEFGNVSWCMAPVDSKMAAARQSVLQHLPQALGDQGTPWLASREVPIERLRLSDARSNGALFLAFVTNADARNGQNDPWTFYHALLQDHPEYAAIRGPGGVGERLVGLVLAGLAGLFFLILLLYIAWQLVVNSVFFVICLLLAPVAILTPAFGDTGRGVFWRWLVWMVEALLKKVIFSIYLGVILLVTRVFLTAAGGIPILSGWLITWLVLAGIWAMALLYRHKILDVMTAGLYHRHGQLRVAQMGGAYAARRYWRHVPQRVVQTEEHHHHQNDHQYGDQYHAHVYVNGNGSRPERVPSYAGDLEGTARDLPPPNPGSNGSGGSWLDDEEPRP